MSTYKIPRFNALRSAMDILNDILPNCKSFKIGKTHDLAQRKSEDDYREKYDHITELYSSTSKILVGYVEALFIDACLEELPTMCDNEKGGYESLNDQMTDSDTYYVYVVWSEKETTKK